MIDAIDPIPIENVWVIDPSDRPKLPFYLSLVHAGFPSPAENYIERRLNLQDLCVKRPDMTYFVKVDGDSMIGAQIFPESILVVDSVELVFSGKVIVAWLEEDLVVRRFIRKNKMIVLEAANDKYLPIYLHWPRDRHKLRVLGCVLHIISKPPKYNHVWISGCE